MPLLGWDSSDFDWPRGPMDLGAAFAAGVRFFTHKATEGTSVKHVHYGEALNRARAAHIPFLGAYIVPRTPGNNGHGSIAQQVAYFLAYVDQQTPWWRDYAGWFWQVDTEHWSNTNGVYDAVHPRYGAEVCDRLQDATGRRALHYAPKWAYGNTVPGSHPLWASSYVGGGNFSAIYPGDGWTGRPAGTGGWAPYSGRTPAILQYSSTATIGRQPTCDANAFRGSEADFRAMIGGTPMALIDDAYFAALVWRMDGLAHAQDTVRGGQYKGEPLELVQALKRIDANVAASKATDAANATAIAGLRAAIDAMAGVINGAGGSVDVAAISAVVDARTAEVKALVEQRHAEEMAELNLQRDAELAALQAELDALRPTQG